MLTQKLKFVLGRVENIVGKGENAGHQHFLFFPQCFQTPFFPEVLKVGIVWQGIKAMSFVWVFKIIYIALLFSDVDVLPEHQDSIVEHLICTKPLVSR